MDSQTLLSVISAVLTFLAGVFGTQYWNTLRNKQDNITKVDLKKIETDQATTQAAFNKSQELIQDLTTQNSRLVSEVERLERKIQELKIVVEKTLSSFEMMMLVLKDAFKEHPELSSALSITYEQIKKAALNDQIIKQ
jgi:predicted nuclease with TOPRIM domain